MIFFTKKDRKSPEVINKEIVKELQDVKIMLEKEKKEVQKG